MTLKQVQDIVAYLKRELVSFAGLVALIAGAVLLAESQGVLKLPDPWHGRAVLASVICGAVATSQMRPYRAREADGKPWGSAPPKDGGQ